MKSAVARRAAHEVALLRSMPPAMRIFDAGMGDGTVVTRVMRSAHRQFPTVPMLVVAKEISLDGRLSGVGEASGPPVEHPATVFVVTNYAELFRGRRVMPRDVQVAAALNWEEVRVSGTSADEYSEQIEDLAATLASGWQTRPSPRSGNPLIVRPSVLVIYREDHGSCSMA